MICRHFFHVFAYVLLLSVSSLFAELEWEQTEIAQKAAFGQATLEAKYIFKNTGTKPVRILDVTTSCGCTYAGASKEVVASGEAGEVAVFFETEKREGPQRSTIEVFTDEDGAGVYKITFVTDIPSAASLPTRLVRWDEGEAREPHTLTIPTQQGVTLKLLKPKVPLPVTTQLVLVDEPSASKDGAEVASDKTEKAKQPLRKYELTITPIKGGKSGAGLLPIEATLPNGKTRTYQIYVQVK